MYFHYAICLDSLTKNYFWRTVMSWSVEPQAFILSIKFAIILFLHPSSINPVNYLRGFVNAKAQCKTWLHIKKPYIVFAEFRNNRW